MTREEILNQLRELNKTTHYFYNELVDEDGTIYIVERTELVEEKKAYNHDKAEHERLVKELIKSVSKDAEKFTVESLTDLIRHIDVELKVDGLYNDVFDQYKQILEVYAQTNPVEAYDELGNLYYFGAPSLGIFREDAKAIPYYKSALQESSISDFDKERIKGKCTPSEHSEGDVYNFKMHIKCDKNQMECIKKVVDKVTEHSGVPTNDFGLYASIPEIMQILVGNTDYWGNVLQMECTDTSVTLKLESELRTPEALKYALQIAFGEMDIEIEDL